MIRMLVRAGIFVGSSAIGVLVATLFLDDMTVTFEGFVITIVVFAVAQSVLTPFLASYVQRNARAFLGGVGLVSTFVALLVATIIGDSLTIDGAGTWVLAALIVWLATALATLLLPVALVKAGVRSARTRTE